ncbi:MAG: TRAP transporter small permease [Paracoccaceae bacterium]|nr:TRAP transporter small permease [Paracoccaceae bacterium]
MALGAGVVLGALVAITFCDVLMRYFLSAPLRGRQDIVEMGMVLCVTLAAPYTWRSGGHISVDLYDSLPLKTLELMRALFVKLMLAGLFSVIAWRSIAAAEDAALFFEATNMILIPHRPFVLVILAVASIHAAILIVEVIAEPLSATKSDDK